MLQQQPRLAWCVAELCALSRMLVGEARPGVAHRRSGDGLAGWGQPDSGSCWHSCMQSAACRICPAHHSLTTLKQVVSTMATI